jgi:hypothetical protein
MIRSWTEKLDELNGNIKKARTKYMSDEITREEFNDFKLTTEVEIHIIETCLKLPANRYE